MHAPCCRGCIMLLYVLGLFVLHKDDNFNFDVALFLQEYWKLVQADAQYEVSKAIGKYVMIIIFILGTVGNLLSFAVMVQRNMRASSTAFYMASLALADTVVLLVGCLRRWVVEMFEVDLLNESPAACYIVNFLQYWSFDVAVWILVIMTMDRVVVVTSPLKAQVYATRRRAAIALIIVLTACAGINLHFFFTTEYSDNVCTAKKKHLEFFNSIWSWIDATVYSFLPFVLLLVMNVVIIVFMGQADRRKRNMTNQFKIKRSEEQRNTINSRKLTIMLLSITCAFIILTAPSMVINILREKGQPYFNLDNPKDMAKYILTRQVSRILLYLNHSINFFLYCITGSKFRRELSAMLQCLSARERHRKKTLRMSVASIAEASMTNLGYSTSFTESSP